MALPVGFHRKVSSCILHLSLLSQVQPGARSEVVSPLALGTPLVSLGGGGRRCRRTRTPTGATRRAGQTRTRPPARPERRRRASGRALDRHGASQRARAGDREHLAGRLEAPASCGNVAGNASPEASLRQVRQKTPLQTHRRPRNRAFLGRHRFSLRRGEADRAAICGAPGWTGRQFTPLLSGQGVNLRRAEGAISPLAGARRGVYCHTRKTGVWTLPVVRKRDAPTNGGGEAAEGRRGEKKRDCRYKERQSVCRISRRAQFGRRHRAGSRSRRSMPNM